MYPVCARASLLKLRRTLSEGGACKMSRRNSIMSDGLKYEIAKELGVYDTVQREGWGSVSSRDCGNMVKKAIEMAGRQYQ
jgi:small acid-soluble spore protein F (minor alpha/beta-type SASP)